jgi:hypothetical protein
VGGDLAAALLPWHDFFVAAAGASAVLLGLVFVAISLHYDPRNLDRYLVGMTTEAAVPFFYATLVSLVMLVPIASPWVPSGALLVVGLLATMNSAIPLFGSWFRPSTSGSAGRTTGQRVKLALPWIAALALLPSAVGLLVAPTATLYAVGGLVLAFVAFGMQNAWDAVLRRDLRRDQLAEHAADRSPKSGSTPGPAAR